MKSHCTCKDVKIQEYQSQIEIHVPDFIDIGKEYLSIDNCIIPEIYSLWKKGVITTGCCCGHNLFTGYIGVIKQFKEIMLSLRYIEDKRSCNSLNFISKTCFK